MRSRSTVPALRKQKYGLVFALCLSPLGYAQTINMSHDLVTLGIAAQNMTPNNPSLDSTPLFQAALNYAQTHPVQTLTVDKGAYYLLSNTQSNAVLLFWRLSNLTVDLTGSTLYFNGPLVPNGLSLFYCSNLTLANFQIDYIHPPYTHVKLTSVDIGNRLLYYETLPDWPDPATFNTLTDPFGGPIQGFWAAIFRNGSIVPGTTRTLLQAPFANSALKIQDGPVWGQGEQAPTSSTLQTGDTVVVYARGGGPAIQVTFADGLTFSNIAIYGAQGVQLISTSNSTMQNLRFAPRPGSGLIGGVGGIGFLPPGPNNHILNCYASRTLDDAFVFEDSGPATVVSQSSPRQLTVANLGYLFGPNGTPMNFVDPGSTIESTGGIIVDQNPPDPNFRPGNVSLTFDRDLPTIPAGTFMVYGSAATRGQGSTVEDTVVEDTYGGRGISLVGVEGMTVRRNVVRRTSMSGIILDQSADAAVDSADLNPPSHDVVITDNVLEGALGPAPCGTGMGFCIGAIEIESTNNQEFGFAFSPSNTNITVQNNYIADSGRSGIWVGELNGGTLQNNLIIRSSQNPTLGGVAGIPPPFQTQVMQDALQPVVIHYSSGVSEINDTVSATSNITAPVTVTPASAIMPALAGNGSFNVQTAVTGFAWNASSDSSWLTITSPVPGAGAGVVQYSVSANNTGAQRTGHITVAGEVFTVTQTTLVTAVLGVNKTHTGYFIQGQRGGTYTVSVSNQAGAAPSAGTVTVTETIPQGLSMVSMAGNGWTCPANGNMCTRGDSLSGGSSYPPITVTVNVDSNAPASVVNQVTVSGGGSASGNANDPTTITPPTAGLGFYSVTPCRAVDTRASQGKSGAFGPPAMAAYSGRDFPLTQSTCALAGAPQAYSLNFTVVPPGPLDFLSAWPATQPFPGVSTLNSPDGSTIANAAIVPAGTNGAIAVTTGESTDLIIDVNGYFGPPNGSDLAFYPVTPCRVADTRSDQGKTGAFGPPALAPYSGRVFPVRSSSCNIPSNAQAYALNLTVVPPGPLSFLSIWPADKPFPGVSTLNSNDGSIIANAAIVPAAANGDVEVTAGNATDFIMDINGYFATPGAPGALHFYPVVPCRVADTRASQAFTGSFGPPGLSPYQGRTIPVLTSRCSIPSTAKAYSLNFTVVPQSPLSFLSAWPSDKPFPNVSTLNSPKGLAIANAAIVPAAANGGIEVTAGNATDLIIDINGYFAP